MIRPFEKPVFVTQPALPSPDRLYRKIKKIWKTKQLSNNGSEAIALESSLASYLGAENLSVYCNGTVALQLACKALKLSGEVITTPFTFAATVNVLDWNNLTPVFCDVEENSFDINADLIESLITPKTSAIMPVHVFGYPCNVEKIQQIADRYRLKVIYDAAHAFGVKVNGRPIASFGDATMFSFHATKVYHTIEGGGVAYSSAAQKQAADRLRNFGLEPDGDVAVSGINGKMNEVQAAVGLLMLEQIDHEIEKRKKITDLYCKWLADVPGITVHRAPDGVEYNYPYLIIRVDAEKYGISRDVLHDKLKEYGIVTRKYFYPLCSNFTCYRHLPSADQALLPVANRIADTVLSLPLYGTLEPRKVRKICRILKALSI